MYIWFPNKPADRSSIQNKTGCSIRAKSFTFMVIGVKLRGLSVLFGFLLILTSGVAHSESAGLLTALPPRLSTWV